MVTLKTDEKASCSRQPRLLDRVRETARLRHYSRRTEKAYVGWIRRFILFHGKRHPDEMSRREVEAFLSHLAVRGKVSASTQTQAFSALLFLYRDVLNREIGWLESVVRARKPVRYPVVLTRQEVQRVLSQVTGPKWIVAVLLYGGGLRLMECLHLRVHDIDFESNQITVRDGKGFKDRVTTLPGIVKQPLLEHLERVRAVHQKDLAEGWGTVQMPYALARKYPRASAEWG
jgi:integron integrase